MTARVRLLLAAAIVVAGVLTPTTLARADSPTVFGWWTSENIAPPVPLPIGPIPTLVPTGHPLGIPSDIPPRGFEVERTGGLVAYAAFVYDVYGGATLDQLVLHAANVTSVAPTNKVQACPLSGSSAFASAAGAPISDGPAYDCTAPVAGTIDTTAQTVTFAVGPLLKDGRLSVAIVAASDGTRMVFDPPDDRTVVVSGGSGPVPAPSSSSAAPSVVAPPSQSTFRVTPVRPARPKVTPAPAAPTAPSGGGATAAAPLVATTPPSASSSGGSAFIGGLLVLAGVVAVAIRNRRALGDVGEQFPLGA